jgi:hypothetical protein
MQFFRMDVLGVVQAGREKRLDGTTVLVDGYVNYEVLKKVCREGVQVGSAGKFPLFTPMYGGWPSGTVRVSRPWWGAVPDRLPLPGGGRDGTLKGRRSRNREPREIE